MTQPVLSVRNLRVEFPTRRALLVAIEDPNVHTRQMAINALGEIGDHVTDRRWAWDPWRRMQLALAHEPKAGDHGQEAEAVDRPIENPRRSDARQETLSFSNAQRGSEQ